MGGAVELSMGFFWSSHVYLSQIAKVSVSNCKMDFLQIAKVFVKNLKKYLSIIAKTCISLKLKNAAFLLRVADLGPLHSPIVGGAGLLFLIIVFGTLFFSPPSPVRGRVWSACLS